MKRRSQSAIAIMKRRPRPPSVPFSADEDDKLREIMALGLSHEFWHLALPGRRHQEICARRLDLGVRCAPLL